MRETTETKQRRILNALLQGRKLTPFDANGIGKTSDGTRFIRRIREKWPVKDMRVAGERYYLYWMDEDFLHEWWKSGSSLAV